MNLFCLIALYSLPLLRREHKRGSCAHAEVLLFSNDPCKSLLFSPHFLTAPTCWGGTACSPCLLAILSDTPSVTEACLQRAAKRNGCSQWVANSLFPSWAVVLWGLPLAQHTSGATEESSTFTGCWLERELRPRSSARSKLSPSFSRKPFLRQN